MSEIEQLARSSNEAQHSGDVARLAKGAGFSLVGRIFGRFLGVVGDVIATRILTTDVFGLYAIGWTILRMSEIIAPFGLDKGIIRLVSGKVDGNLGAARQFIFRMIRNSMLFGVFFGAILFFGAPWIANNVFEKPGLINILKVLALAVPFTVLLNVAISATRAQLTVKYIVIVQDLGQPIVGLAVLGGLYFWAKPLTTVLVADILSYLIPALVALWIANRLYPAGQPAAEFLNIPMGEVLKFSLPLSTTVFMVNLLTWVDRLIVGVYRTEAETGIYQVVSQMTLLFATILGSFASITIPMFAALFNANEKKRMQELYLMSTKWMLYISLPLLMVVWLSPETLLTFFFKPAYASGAGAMIVLSIGQLINVATGSVGPLLAMTDHQNLWLRISAGGLVMNTLANIWLVPLYGIMGSAIATSVSVSLMFIVAVFVLWQKTGMLPYDRRYFKGIASAVLTFGFLVLLKLPERFPPFFSLALLGILAVTIFFGLLNLFKLDSEDKQFIEILKQRVLSLMGNSSNQKTEKADNG